MEEFLLGIIDGGINFNSVGQIILIYIALLWTMIALWVFFDARKRFDNIFLPLGFFLAVLILNFPVLILYIIVRPEHSEFSEASTNLSIPVVDFVKEDGSVEFSLKVNLIPVSGNSYILKTSSDNIQAPEIKPLATENTQLGQRKKFKPSRESLKSFVNRSREKSKSNFNRLKTKLPRKNNNQLNKNPAIDDNSKEL